MQVKADLLFSNDEVRLNDMQVDQGGGMITMNAILSRENKEGTNPLSLQSHIDHVELTKLFISFDNFGQDALSGKNLKGKLTANIRMTGLLNNKAAIVKNSLKGEVDFSLKDGQLLDFEPMQKIHEGFLKNKDLSEIKFSELKNQLDVDSTTITVHRMEIQSTAFTLFAEGIYDLERSRYEHPGAPEQFEVWRSRTAHGKKRAMMERRGSAFV